MSTAHRSDPDLRAGAESRPKPRVLIVDDRLTSREIVKVALGTRDYEVSEARSGEEGLAMLHHEQPRATPSLWSMTTMNGVDTWLAAT